MKLNYINNTFILAPSKQTTNSDISVEGKKGGGEIKEGDNTISPAVTPTEAVTENKETTSSTGVSDNTAPESAPTGLFGGNIMVTIVIYVVGIGLLYYFMTRKQRTRDKEIQDMRKSLQVGDDIVTSAGYFGKIVDIGNDVFVVEFGTNKGVRIPVKKSEIIQKATPDFSKPEQIESK